MVSVLHWFIVNVVHSFTVSIVKCVDGKPKYVTLAHGKFTLDVPVL